VKLSWCESVFILAACNPFQYVLAGYQSDFQRYCKGHHELTDRVIEGSRMLSSWWNYESGTIAPAALEDMARSDVDIALHADALVKMCEEFSY